MEDVQENQPITLDLKPKELLPQDLNFQTVWVETVPKFKVTSVAFHSTQKITNLYVGTSDGTISLYQFKLHKQKENQSGGHAFAAPCYLSCGTNVGKSSVLNLVIIESYDHIAALCDGKLHMLKLKNLKLTTTLRIPAGIQGYAFQTFPKETESHEQTSNNKLCFYIKTTLYLYDLDLGTTYKQLYLPEVPTDIVWIQNSIIVGLSKECSKIDLSRNCQVDQLWPTSTNRIKALPSGEVIICSASANRAVLVDVRDHQISTTLPSIPNAQIGYVFPYVVFAKEKSLHIYDRFVPGRDQEIVFNDCTFLIDGGDMCVVVNKQNEISVLVQNTMNYQCVNEDVLPVISKHSFDELVLTQFFKKFFMAVNPFGALVDYFVQKIYSKYYTSLAASNTKNIETIIKTGIKPDINHYTLAVHKTMYDYLVGSIKLEDSSLETYEEISKSSIYEYIFAKMYSQLLFPLYCKLYSTEDKVYLSNAVKLKNIPLKTLGLKKKYWLTKESLKQKRRKSELPKIAPSKLFAAKYAAEPFNSLLKDVSVHTKNDIVYIVEGDPVREIKHLSIDKLYFNKTINSILFQDESQIGRIDFDAETFMNFKKEMKKGSVLFEDPVIEKPSEETEAHAEEDAERILFLEREEYVPYQASMEKLRTLAKYSSMQDKLECILGTIQDTVQAVKEFWQAASSKKNVLIGADDLLPILVYVVLKAEVPNIHAEVNCLLDFIEEKTMSGQLGYSLCTLKSVLMAIEAIPGADKSSEVSATPETTTAVTTATTAPSTSDLDFVKRFKLPEGQHPITYFNCGYLFATGKLYVCPNYLCFEALIIFPVQNVVIPFTDIAGIEKTTTLALIPTAVEVTKTNGEKYKFVGLINRNEVYDSIQNQMKAAGVVTTK